VKVGLAAVKLLGNHLIANADILGRGDAGL
jgi:hypothetical protein